MKNNIFEFFLCNENGMKIKGEDGKTEKVIIQAQDLDDAMDQFSELYPNCFWEDYMEFGE